MLSKTVLKPVLALLGITLVFQTCSADVPLRNLVHEGTVTIIDRTATLDSASEPVAFGLNLLYAAIKSYDASVKVVPHWSLTDQPSYLVIGTTANRAVARLLPNASEDLSRPEGVFFQTCDTGDGTALVVAGTDERGLMYALLELAERVETGGLAALNKVTNLIEFPDNAVRGVDRFVGNFGENPWLFDHGFWDYYLDRLARARYNRLTLIMGYDSDYLVPPYPFFLEVPGFEDVRVKNKAIPNRAQHLALIRFIAQHCHDHGLEFVMASWRHNREKDYVEGSPVEADRYTDYCARGMRNLLVAAPEIDGVQMRINWESGVGEYGATAEKFWHDIIQHIGEAGRLRGRDVHLDLRAKGLTPDMINWALEAGLNFSIPTKYTWEAMGLPYHTTQFRSNEITKLDNMDTRQRYSYADFLRKPRPFDVFYRLWTIGTNRFFVWGDPDYARRFSQTAGFGGATGFEITPPFALKRGTWDLFKNPDLITYRWEDERYWAWYLLFGRLGYSVNTPADVWQREFSRRFGAAAEPLLAAHASAGKILPLLTTAHLTHHPAEWNWAEMDTGAALFSEHNVAEKHDKKNYQTIEPGDPGLFYAIDDYVKDYRSGSLKAKYNPMQVSRWYQRLAADTVLALKRIDPETIPANHRAEYQTTELDLLLTADLGEFHAFKTHAAVDLVFYQQTEDANYLRATLGHMKEAGKVWARLCERTRDTYHDQPTIQNYDLGKNWFDRLVEVEKDIAKLQGMVEKARPGPITSHANLKQTDVSADFLRAAKTNVPETFIPNRDLHLSVVTDALPYPVHQSMTLHYRHANLVEGRFKTLPMQFIGKGFESVIPANYLTPQYDLLVYFSVLDEAGNAHILPGLFHPEQAMPYYVIQARSLEEALPTDRNTPKFLMPNTSRSISQSRGYLTGTK
ncbi:hypothetical protein ACFL6U_10980 [Planctomycetota bacterium]